MFPSEIHCGSLRGVKAAMKVRGRKMQQHTPTLGMGFDMMKNDV